MEAARSSGIVEWWREKRHRGVLRHRGGVGPGGCVVYRGGKVPDHRFRGGFGEVGMVLKKKNKRFPEEKTGEPILSGARTPEYDVV